MIARPNVNIIDSFNQQIMTRKWRHKKYGYILTWNAYSQKARTLMSAPAYAHKKQWMMMNNTRNGMN